MSSSFDQPDDAASWRWNRGEVRSTHDILSDVDAALNLLEEINESEPTDSRVPGSHFPGPADLTNWSSSVTSEFQHLAEPDLDCSRIGESVLVAPASFLLQQVARVQEAVSVAIVTSQCEDCTSDLDRLGGSHAVPNPTAGRQGTAVPSDPFHDIQLESGDLSGIVCCQCHPSGQQYGLWLKVAEAVSRSSLRCQPDIKGGSTQSGSEQERDLLYPVALGIEKNTVYVAFDGEKFVKVVRPARSVEAANNEAANNEAASTEGGSSAGESYADQEGSGSNGSSPVLHRRNGQMWGPHWTLDLRAEKNSSNTGDSKPVEPSPEGCVDKEAFQQPADQRRAPPESDAARSRLRRNATKSHCLRCNATQETCLATPLSSRNSAGCHDRRSCKVRDRKGDQ